MVLKTHQNLYNFSFLYSFWRANFCALLVSLPDGDVHLRQGPASHALRNGRVRILTMHTDGRG